jgi:hypothetical protein
VPRPLGGQHGAAGSTVENYKCALRSSGLRSCLLLPSFSLSGSEAFTHCKSSATLQAVSPGAVVH